MKKHNLTPRIEYLCHSMFITFIMIGSVQAQHALNDLETIVNGSFSKDQSGWYIGGSLSTYNTNAAYDNKGHTIQLQPAQTEQFVAFLLQPVSFFPGCNQAKFSINQRFEIIGFNPGFSQYGSGLFIEPSPGAQALIQLENITDSTQIPGEWKTAEYQFTAEDLQAIHQHLQNGGRLYFIAFLVASDIVVNLDAISLTQSGTMEKPDTIGSIAYLRGDTRKNEIRIVEPDGSQDHRVWKIEEIFADTTEIFDLVWHPDATELAFTSSHESHQSSYSSDVFAIRPDGSGIRRITNYPSINHQPDNMPTGTVEGTVFNNSSKYLTVLVILHGADDPVSVMLSPQTSSPFRIENVRDFGVGVYQTLSLFADGYREITPALVDVIPGETIQDVQATYNRQSHRYEPRQLSWSSDGSQIAFMMDGLLRRITPNPTEYTISKEVFSNLGEGSSMGVFDWSPVDDWILYEKFLKGIYRIQAGSTTEGEQLLQSMNAANPNWLPDTSGFIYSDLGTNLTGLLEYDIASKQSTPLVMFYNEYVGNISVSWSDAKYIVFTRYSTSYEQSNLWIIQRDTPGRFWPLTTDGMSDNADWSRKEITLPSLVHDAWLY